MRTSSVPIINIRQLTSLIHISMSARRPILITGAPGIGKTSAPVQLCQEQGWNLMIQHPVVSDPTDAKGMPCLIRDPETGKDAAVFLPFGDLKKMMDYPADEGTAPMIVFIDDLGQAPPMVQAAYMQLLLAREINGKKISPNVHFLAATNRKEDRAGVKGILEPVKSRFAAIVELQPSLDEWVSWALKSKIYPSIIPFIRFCPPALMDFVPTAGMEQSPCPRTWHMLSDMLYQYDALQIDDVSLRSAMVTGSIGEGRTGEFLAFERIYQGLPDLDYLIDNPEKIKDLDTSNVSLVYAVIVGIATRCTMDNIRNILLISASLPQEFSSYMINDCLQVEPGIAENEDFLNWCVENSDIFM